MTDHDPADSPDGRAERALRDTLHTHAEAPIFRPLQVAMSADRVLAAQYSAPTA